MVSYGNGYYRLYPQNLSSMVLYTPYRDLTEMKVTAAGTSVKQRFKFVRNWDGSYHILSEYSGNEAGLASYSTSSTVFHDYVEVDMSFLDDWTLEPVGKDTATSVCAVGFSTPFSWQTYIQEMGYTFSNINNVQLTTAMRTLLQSNIWICNSHGSSSMLQLQNSSGGFEYIVASPYQDTGTDFSMSIDNLSENSLASSRCILALGCQGGLNDITSKGKVNLASSMYRKGAHLIIAFSDLVANDEWIDYFLAYCKEGLTAAEAMALADRDMYDNSDNIDYGNCMNRHVLGDTAATLTVRN